MQQFNDQLQHVIQQTISSGNINDLNQVKYSIQCANDLLLTLNLSVQLFQQQQFQSAFYCFALLADMLQNCVQSKAFSKQFKPNLNQFIEVIIQIMQKQKDEVQPQFYEPCIQESIKVISLISQNALQMMEMQDFIKNILQILQNNQEHDYFFIKILYNVLYYSIISYKFRSMDEQICATMQNAFKRLLNFIINDQKSSNTKLYRETYKLLCLSIYSYGITFENYHIHKSCIYDVQFNELLSILVSQININGEVILVIDYLTIYQDNYLKFNELLLNICSINVFSEMLHCKLECAIFVFNKLIENSLRLTLKNDILHEKEDNKVLAINYLDQLCTNMQVNFYYHIIDYIKDYSVINIYIEIFKQLFNHYNDLQQFYIHVSCSVLKIMFSLIQQLMYNIQTMIHSHKNLERNKILFQQSLPLAEYLIYHFISLNYDFYDSDISDCFQSCIYFIQLCKPEDLVIYQKLITEKYQQQQSHKILYGLSIIANYYFNEKFFIDFINNVVENIVISVFSDNKFDLKFKLQLIELVTSKIFKKLYDNPDESKYDEKLKQLPTSVVTFLLYQSIIISYQNNFHLSYYIQKQVLINQNLCLENDQFLSCYNLQDDQLIHQLLIININEQNTMSQLLKNMQINYQQFNNFVRQILFENQELSYFVNYELFLSIFQILLQQQQQNEQSLYKTLLIIFNNLIDSSVNQKRTIIVLDYLTTNPYQLIDKQTSRQIRNDYITNFRVQLEQNMLIPDKTLNINQIILCLQQIQKFQNDLTQGNYLLFYFYQQILINEHLVIDNYYQITQLLEFTSEIMSKFIINENIFYEASTNKDTYNRENMELIINFLIKSFQIYQDNNIDIYQNEEVQNQIIFILSSMIDVMKLCDSDIQLQMAQQISRLICSDSVIKILQNNLYTTNYSLIQSIFMILEFIIQVVYNCEVEEQVVFINKIIIEYFYQVFKTNTKKTFLQSQNIARVVQLASHVYQLQLGQIKYNLLLDSFIIYYQEFYQKQLIYDDILTYLSNCTDENDEILKISILIQNDAEQIYENSKMLRDILLALFEYQ